jgi:cysteine desulfurase
MAESADQPVKTPVYLDYQATTPMDPRVLDAMLPYYRDIFGNPHSTSHSFGWRAADAVEKARGQVAALVGADPKEIVFTSGATESNNLAIKGVARFYRKAPGKRDHIVTVATEHKCVLEACRSLEQDGFSITYLPVDETGLIDLDELQEAITDKTILVSDMSVNNEIGVIQPLSDIGMICRERKVFFHSDAAQALGKIPLVAPALLVDLMSLSGHKIYGPKGIGALYIRRKSRVRLDPLLSGGGQEGGIRSGTLSPALCVGFGEACAIAREELAEESARIVGLSHHFMDGLHDRLDGITLNGDEQRRYPGNINLSFEGVDGELLIAELRDLAVSSGAACASASDEPSYVLAAIGLSESEIKSSIRFGIGRFTTVEEIDFAIGYIADAVTRLRRGEAA